MRVLLLMVVVGCAADAPGDLANQGPGPEIDGEYLDASSGACIGGVGGTTRCSGNPCVEMGERACGTAAACFLTYEVTGTPAFRSCLPVSLDRPRASGGCATLGAEDCATRSDCAGVYRGVSIFSSFVRCEDNLIAGQKVDTRAQEPVSRQAE